MKKFNLILTILVFYHLAFSKPDIITNDVDDDKRGKIIGFVIDESTKQPMEYANIAIYTIEDSTLVTGGITNENGQFEITGMGFGDYYLEANFIGFEKSSVTNIVLDRKNNILELGTIDLSPSAVALAEVNVVADKAAVEYKLDKKVVNVSQVISAVGGTAVDVLENTPSVQVDIEGNVSLRGSSNFTVLIDGRPSVLSGSDALRQIPASALENIEIITNPSAKYEPDGTAGIINLVMKKNAMNGVNGIVNVSVGTGDRYRGDFTLNYRTEKANYFIGADYRDETNYGNIFRSTETFRGDTTEYLNINGNRDFVRSGFNVKAGVDLYLGKNTTLTLAGETGNSLSEQNGGGKTENYTNPASFAIYSVNEEISARENDFYSLNANFQHKFNDKGHRIEASAFYSGEEGTDDELEGEILADAMFNKTSEYLSRVSSMETEEENEFRFKLDYTNPFSENGRFEAGLQSRLESEIETMDFSDFNTATNSWEINDDFSSSTDFRRDIHAVYSTFANKTGKLEYMAGLRGELTLREIMNTKATKASSLNRFDVFPTAHFSYPVHETTELMASYSRRINRPSGRDLDPMPTYYNRYTLRFGNPDLKPEYTNSFEIGALKRFGNQRSYLSADVFRRITNNKIDRTETLGNDGVFYLYTDNFDKDYSTGLEVTANLSYKEWLILNTSVSMFNYRITGELNGESFDRESTNWSGRMNTTLKFGENSRMQITGFYRGPSVSAQGESKGMFYSNFSYRHEFLERKLSATVSLQDPFGTGNFERESFGENFNSSFRWQREPRVVMLTLSYKINNFKEDRGDRGGMGGMDMGGGEY